MARIPALSLLVIALAACSSTPPAPPAATSATSAASAAAPAQAQAQPQPQPNAVDPAVIQALNDMGKYLQSLRQFEVFIDLSGERVLQDGQKLQHTATADLDVQRPDRLRALMRSARSQRDLIYDGKKVTLYSPAQKSYSQADFSDNLGVLAQRLRERFGVEIPSADLFLWGTPEAPVDNIESAMNAGQDIVGGELCDHYAFRQGQLDWQIWIATGNRPLPRKLVITNRSDEARPQSVTQYRWNLNPRFGNSAFAFAPPKDARKAEFVPLKATR
ncbi:DUF2092 domain-containing protein [Cupriavidus oxalaticus]|uniref:DUF2092 domain-containing protein n=1 Tax=Cupriavidus oxalaticus TaxID=96344 RepID=A0A976BH92_9BURK|nr:DUF2092 domain-containing protein [Cupriavidus oxalaticus]QRQ83885.1 DUF2092 domain-containing protein [Cupriavidus oxalaticus]QRQ92026.1 DUF2092 domain-containing protein [Cupriavidus oxalaticus]WQD86624.1 DUF2092 domain-containing protein [Cupriavidus oxalaticus]SPC19377.1 conserved exported hypothetical protein [Cupriavidus oxalaticus]